MKTNDLTGNELCFAACMAEMPHLVWGKTIGMHEHSYQIIVPELREPFCYSPFVNWGMCGPIIEREGISVAYIDDNIADGAWFASTVGGDENTEGPTPLIAAMRCYVASKLGDTVEIPEELT